MNATKKTGATTAPSPCEESQTTSNPIDWDAMSHEARELALYALNTSEVYERHVVPTHRSLARHMRRGEYSSAAAVRAWRHVADACAKDYARSYDHPSRWAAIFSTSDRQQAAEYLEATERETVADVAKEG